MTQSDDELRERVEEWLDDLSAALLVRERQETDTGERLTLEELATFIADHRLLALSDENIVAPISLAEALINEGWTPPPLGEPDA